MNCDEFEPKVHEYLRGSLSGAERSAVEAHVAACEACRRTLSTLEELTCREFVEFLLEYVDGALPAERAAVFERHLGVCPDCTAYVDGYRKTMDLSVAALSGLDEEIPEALVRAILDARRKG